MGSSKKYIGIKRESSIRLIKEKTRAAMIGIREDVSGNESSRDIASSLVKDEISDIRRSKRACCVNLFLEIVDDKQKT